MSTTGAWLQGRTGFAPLSAVLVPTPGIPAGQRVRMCWSLLQTCCPGSGSTGLGVLGFLPEVPAMVGAREVLGSERDPEMVFLGVCLTGILHWCSSGSAQLLGLSVSVGDQQDLLLPVKTVPSPCKAVSPQPQLSLAARTCLCGEPQSREPQLGAQDRGDVGTQGGLVWSFQGQWEREGLEVEGA